MAKILITGVKGVIGSYLNKMLIDRGHEVFGIDLRHYLGEIGWEHEMSNGQASYSRCDIADFRQLERVFEKYGPFDYVYNTAAEFGRWNGEDFYEQLWRSNVIGTKNVIRLQEKYKFKMIHFSSSEVYGDYDDVMIEGVMDKVEIKQMNDYAMSKWVNEMQIRNSIIQYGTETVVVRLFNTYGPGEWYHPYRSVNCKFCYHAINGLPVTVYRGHYRTSTYLEDTCRTLCNIVDNFKSGEAYNIGGLEYHDIETLVKMIWDYTGADQSLITYKDAEILTTKSKKVSVEKAVKELDHKLTVTMEEGIKKTIDWMRDYYKNKQRKKIAVILGARPNFVKVAPFFKEAKNRPEFEFTLIHTGQHFDENMSKIFFDEMDIPKPDIMLNIKGERHTEKIGKMFTALREYFEKNKFDRVIIFGDVNSTLAAGIAAAKNNLSLVHIEAGLRSHDRRMPEEINRAIVDHLSDLLFTTEESGNKNLKLEGISDDKVKYVGNIMINSIEIFKDKINASDVLEKLNLKSKDYYVVTIHRQENTDDPQTLKTVLSILKEISQTSKLIFPMHPGTRNKIKDLGLGEYLECIQVVEPLGYFEFMKLMIESNGVITDSGGIQEETSHLGIPCATLRDNTERPSTLILGSNKLFPLSLDSVDGVISHLQRSDFKPGPIPLWDDQVAKRIFDNL